LPIVICAATPRHIDHVLFLAASDEVSWIAAAWIIAGVTRYSVQKPLPVVQFPCNPACILHRSINLEFAVSILVD
jgi:hypothetical protein